MEHETHRATLARYTAEVWTDGNLNAAGLYCTGLRAAPAKAADRGARPSRGAASGELYRTAFPDLRIEVFALVGEADQLVGHSVFHQTHQNDLFAVPPIGRLVAFSAMGRFRFNNGKIAEQ